MRIHILLSIAFITGLAGALQAVTLPWEQDAHPATPSAPSVPDTLPDPLPDIPAHAEQDDDLLMKMVELEQRAEMGGGAARFELGLLKLEMDEIEAGMQLIRQMADQGYLRALPRYAEAGDAVAQFHLGEAMQIVAINWSPDDDPSPYDQAMTTVVAIFVAHGIRKDEEAALDWFRRAAEQDHAMAQYNMGFEAFLNDQSDEARQWYQRAAALGNREARAALERLEIYMENRALIDEPAPPGSAAAIQALRQRAELGDPQAQTALGFELLLGTWDVKADPTEGVRWLRRAAQQGDAHGQLMLGSAYKKGIGVEQDDTEAFRWFRRAAEQGNPRASFNVAVCFERGLGVTADHAQALEWFRKAAALDYAPAAEKVEALTAAPTTAPTAAPTSTPSPPRQRR